MLQLLTNKDEYKLTNKTIVYRLKL